MERVAFLIEPNGPRLACLLNPEGLTVKREAGVSARRAGGGPVAGRGLSDDPLHFTGGGATELSLDLMFDVDLIASPARPSDVRDLTGPLWRLTENVGPEGNYGPPPIVRFIWGKVWNIAGVATAVSERFDRFSADGMPRRSWVRMRLCRVPDESVRVPPLTPPGVWPVIPDPIESSGPGAGGEGGGVGGLVHSAIGSGAEADEPSGGERLDEIAQRYYGSASLWRLLALANDVVDPIRVEAGSLLQVPGSGAGGAAP